MVISCREESDEFNFLKTLVGGDRMFNMGLGEEREVHVLIREEMVCISGLLCGLLES